MGVILTDEQILFLKRVYEGHNVLVDACIGSGKTTAIQSLCNYLPADKKILYLTYNKILKIDAKAKIKNTNVFVTNYHGFAYSQIARQGIKCGISDILQTYNKIKPKCPHYDILILDEYQDIEREIAELLCHIKECNPNIQIVAVGDMEQKIYDKTDLDVPAFMNDYMDDRIDIKFTACFRLNKEHASRLGRIWKKEINGVNSACTISIMRKDDVVEFLAKQDPKNVLCLGARLGNMADALNDLEAFYPDKYNKKTVYASINDEDRSTSPSENTAIFTTFDSAKGLERPICVVFDYTESYWTVRIRKPMQSYEILRNIVCVAASRGKQQIIFVENDEGLLSEETLSTNTGSNKRMEDVNISEMFDFKFKEDVEKCYSLLNVKKIYNSDSSIILIKDHDDMIDLSPCIGMYQEAIFFSHYDIKREFELRKDVRGSRIAPTYNESEMIEKALLRLVAADTRQRRYSTQVSVPFVDDKEKEALISRLNSVFTGDEKEQVKCEIRFGHYTEDVDKLRKKRKNPSLNEKEKELKSGISEYFVASGLADVVKDDTVYELKFVSELRHEHFLQLASYMVGLGYKKGILWNTRTNDMYLVSIPDEKQFMDNVVYTVTKRAQSKYIPYN